MAFELPTDLIRQVQAALRNNAGLSSYNPYDPTLQPLPSFASSIADLDPSPPPLRCHHCKGRLLNGVQSLICVYCGKQRNRDASPQPIAFNSTFGYRSLLESLGLDGSESIGAETEGNDTNRGQSTPKDEISLSKLLDLHIRWLDETEKIETSVTVKNLEQNGGLVTLTGTDLENYLKEPNNNIVFNAFPDQPVVTNQIETIQIKEVTGQDNLNLFQNVPEVSGDTSGWEASFQSADHQNQPENSKSADPFISSTVDLADHIDSKSADPFISSTVNLADHIDSKSADPFLSSTVNLADHIDSVFGGDKSLEDGKPIEDSFPAPSMVDSLKDGKSIEDPFPAPSMVDSLQDGKPVEDPFPAPSMVDNWTEDDPFNNLVTDTLNSAAKDEDRRSLDIIKDSSPDNVDWFQKVPVDKDVNLTASHPFDLPINDNILANPSSGSVDWFHDNQWQMNITSMPNDKAVNEDEGSFDEWNDFTSSNNPQAPTSIDAVNEPISGIKMLNSPSNIEEVDFGSFFSGGPNSERQGDSIGNGAENIIASLQPKDDVEMLFSQMHDLSFMLEKNLSVPSKSDAVGSFSHD